MERSLFVKQFWDKSHLLSTKNREYKNYVLELFARKIREDTSKGDVTSEVVVPKGKSATAQIISKESCVLAGLEEVNCFISSGPLSCKLFAKDGLRVKKGKKILEIKGNARKILKIERTVLNILQRMCGIATATEKVARKVNCNVAATRKTRDLLDKKAVSVGKGYTHRLNASDFILIKDNHLKLVDLKDAIINASKSKVKEVEVEVDSAQQALFVNQYVSLTKSNKQWGILFDNMNPSEIKKTIEKINDSSTRDILFEASGGITEKNIKQYDKSGVDIISLGSITHSVRACDLSLEIQ